MTTSISISKIEFKKIWRDAGESSAVKKSQFQQAKLMFLFTKCRWTQLRGEPIHVDFLAIDMKKKIKVNVPLVFEVFQMQLSLESEI